MITDEKTLNEKISNVNLEKRNNKRSVAMSLASNLNGIVPKSDSPDSQISPSSVAWNIVSQLHNKYGEDFTDEQFQAEVKSFLANLGIKVVDKITKKNINSTSNVPRKVRKSTINAEEGRKVLRKPDLEFIEDENHQLSEKVDHLVSIADSYDGKLTLEVIESVLGLDGFTEIRTMLSKDDLEKIVDNTDKSLNAKIRELLIKGGHLGNTPEYENLTIAGIGKLLGLSRQRVVNIRNAERAKLAKEGGKVKIPWLPMTQKKNDGK